MMQEGKHTPESNYYLDYLMTKKGNRDGYTDKQFELAKQAWKLYINTGGGGVNNFKHYLLFWSGRKREPYRKNYIGFW